MGFDPSPEVNARYYAIGFTVGANPAATTQQWIGAMNSGLDNTATTGCAGGAAAQVANVSWFAAGKGIGANFIGTAANHVAAATGLGASALGTQADTANMTFRISAAGIISGDAATAATASVLTIDNGKVISTFRQGF